MERDLRKRPGPLAVQVARIPSSVVLEPIIGGGLWREVWWVMEVDGRREGCLSPRAIALVKCLDLVPCHGHRFMPQTG